MPPVSSGRLVAAEIDSLAFGGKGIARIDGYVLFVEGGLPGDRVLVKVGRTRRSHGEGVVLEVTDPGPHRRSEECTHGDAPCPGAPWQALEYSEQLRWKAEHVTDALGRIGGLAGYELEPIVPAVAEWRYRNKMEYSFGSGIDGTVLGFHRRGEWYTVDGVRDCRLAGVSNNEARNAVLEWSRGCGAEPYDRRTGTGTLKGVVVREGLRTGDRQVELVTASGFDAGSSAVDDLVRAVPDASSVVVCVEADGGGPSEGAYRATVSGSDEIAESLGGVRFGIPAGAFFQTNTEMAERLVAIATEYAGLTGSERLFDLYCGIGTMGLAMARGAGEVWGVDVVEAAVKAAEAGALANGIENARFLTGNARTAIRPLIERAGKADVAVVDPPRAGLSQKVVRRLLETEADRIVYVSCNPTTLAPNARQIVDAGYRLERVRPIDLFPQTPHIECVTMFTRENVG